MNERGNFLLILLVAFVIVALIPPLIMILFPEAADLILCSGDNYALYKKKN